MKISGLPEITTTITDIGYVPVVQDGVTHKVSVGTLKGRFYVRSTWFEAISSTTGTVSITTNGQFVEDNWSQGIDILTTKLDTNGFPTIEIPEDSEGNAVTASLITNNTSNFTYQLSSQPVSYPIGLIYCYRIYNTQFDESKSLEEITIETELKETHNQIRGLQGGDSNNRYHITSTINNIVSTLSNVDGELFYKGLSVNKNCSAGITGTVPTLSISGLQITISASEAIIHDNAYFNGNPQKYNIALASVTVTDNAVNYLAIKYNNGTPIYYNTLDVNEINESNVIPVNTLLVSGCVHQAHWDSLGDGLTNKLHRRLVKTQRYARESGLALASSGSTISVESGIVWRGGRAFELADTFSNGSNNSHWFFYYNVNGSWTSSTGTYSYQSNYYDNRTNLIEILPGRFTINWVFRGVEDHQHGYYILGDKDYKDLPSAIAESSIPEVPIDISSHAILVGRIIVEKNSSSLYVESAFTTQFQGVVINDHNNLSNLQGGTISEYYHLSSYDYNNISGTQTTLSNLYCSVATFGNLSGTSYFEPDGTLKMNGDATTWEDIVLGSKQMGIGASAPDEINLFGTTVIKGYGFDGLSTLEQVYGEAELIHSFKESSTVDIHVHWTPTNTNTGTVSWNANIYAANSSLAGGATIFTVIATLSASEYTDGVAWKHFITPLGLINLTNYKIGAILYIHLYRDPSLNSDTYQSDAALLSIGIHYEKDTLGSRSRYIK